MRKTVQLKEYNQVGEILYYQLGFAWPSKLFESGGHISSVTLSALYIYRVLG